MGTDETVRYEKPGAGERPLPDVKVSKGVGVDGKERYILPHSSQSGDSCLKESEGG